MTEQVKKITENTFLPVSLVIVLIGGVLWLTSVQSDAKTAKDAVEDLKTSKDSQMKMMHRIDVRLSRIEGKLGIQGPLDDE